MMKVVYEISPLGAGHRLQMARTGVFRVVENVAYGLAASEECDLVFAVMEQLAAPKAVRDYLKSSPLLQNVPLYVPALSDVRYGVINGAYSLTARISETSSSLKQFPLKVARRIATHTGDVIEGVSVRFNPKALSDADVFHSTFIPLPKRVKREKKVKKFLTIYDLIPLLYPQYYDTDLMKRILHDCVGSLDQSDFALCISNATKNDLCNYAKHIDPSKVFITHLAASELLYPCSEQERIAYIRSKYKIPADAPYLLSLSTLEPRKNIDQTIRCFVRLVREQRIKDLCLVLVGAKGWSYDKIFEAIEHSSDLKDRIILAGYVPDEDLAPLYSGALAFVYPSLYEGFGLPPLEAMQCGVPVITSNTSSLPEVVGDAGFMHDPADADGICESMLRIYASSDLRKSLSAKSLERAKQFSWERCTQETIAAYRTALNG